MKKTYVTLKDLAEFHKVDKELMTDYLLDKKFLKKENNKLKITDKGESAGIHEVNGKYGKFFLYDKSMNLYDLLKFRKYGTDNKKQKGNSYEAFVGKYFEDKNYIVKYNGFENGMEDNSIDLIAINRNEIILIQCKNWSLDWVKKNKRYITQKDIKSFIGDTFEFLNKYKIYNEWPEVKRLFVVSEYILAKEAFAFIKNNKDIDFLVLKNSTNQKVS